MHGENSVVHTLVTIDVPIVAPLDFPGGYKIFLSP